MRGGGSLTFKGNYLLKALEAQRFAPLEQCFARACSYLGSSQRSYLSKEQSTGSLRGGASSLQMNRGCLQWLSGGACASIREQCRCLVAKLEQK